MCDFTALSDCLVAAKLNLIFDIQIGDKCHCEFIHATAKIYSVF